MKPALAVMARAPIPGQVKTRLQPRLTSRQSADLSLAFLKDVLTLAARQTVCQPFLFFTPGSAQKTFQAMVPPAITLMRQSAGGLGNRMYRIFVELSGLGYSPVLVIGTDIPTLQPDTLRKAVEAMKSYDLCFGPSRDGGYYLVGMNRPDDTIFRGIEWSTPRVLDQTENKARAAGRSFVLLEELSDVDTYPDLEYLRGEIDLLQKTPNATVPFYTAEWLKENRNLFQ